MDSVVLNHQHIIKIIENGIGVGTNRHHEAALRRAITKVQKEELHSSSDSYDVYMLKRIVDVTGRHLFRSIILNDLLSCHFIVLPLDICLAQACIIDNRRLIVVTRGMLDLQYQMNSWRFLKWLIPSELKDIPGMISAEKIERSLSWFVPGFLGNISSDPEIELRKNVQSEFAYLSFILIAMSYRHGFPLPDFRNIQGSNMAVGINDEYTRTIMFMLLHELGHHVLGHCANISDSIGDHELVLNEKIDRYKAREFGADQFVRGAFRDNVPTVTYQGMLEASLFFFYQYELLLGEQGDAHPLCVNRLNHAVMSNLGYAYYGSNIPDHLRNEDWKKGAYAEPAKKIMRVRAGSADGTLETESSLFSAEARSAVINRIKAIGNPPIFHRA